VADKILDTFEETKKRNREPEHGEESEPTNKLKEKDDHLEKEKQEKEEMKEHEEAVKRE